MKQAMSLDKEKQVPLSLSPNRTFRFILFLLFGVIFSAMATNLHAQDTRISLNARNTTVHDVLKMIESKSDYHFAYNNKLVDVTRQVDVTATNEKISDILKRIFANTDVTFTVVDHQIVLASAKAMGAPIGQSTSERVSGKVIDENGQVLPGVTVVIQGTTKGTISDANGNYSLPNVLPNETLEFSFVGMQSKEVNVGNKSVLNVALSESSTGLNEVVVTALNITRDKKSLGYSVQQVSGSTLNVAAPTDLATSLAGQISGIQTFGSASSSFDDSQIRIRGVNDLNGDGPLYVVDGTPISHSDIDMESVKSISVLKGPAAAALYGQRASRGVILITTKNGERDKPLTVELNSTVKFESIRMLPQLQNSYAEGIQNADGSAYQFPVYSYNPSLDPSSWSAWSGEPMLDYTTEQSWGPKMDGQMVRQWNSWYPNDPDYGKMTPLVPQPNNVKDFFRTGITLQNDVAVSGGNDKYNVRLAYDNQQRTLIFPGSNRNRNFFNIAGSYDVNSKINVAVNLNIDEDHEVGNPDNMVNVYSTLESSFPRQLNINDLRNYTAGQFRFRSWNLQNPNTSTANDFLYDNQISSNIFTEALDNTGTSDLSRLYGDVQLTYKITDDLKLEGAFRTDYNNGIATSQIVSGSRPNNSDGTSNDSFSENYWENFENNYELLLSYNKRINDFSFSGIAGSNIRYSKNQNINASTNGGLEVPGVYSIAESTLKANVSDGYNVSEARSIYGRASFGYKDLLYLDGTLRNDWSSTLALGNNSYLYPSASLSMVFSQFLSGIVSNKIFSFGKLRLSAAQVGSDMGPYNINTTLPLTTSYGTAYPAQGLSSNLLNPEIKPTLSTSYEGGIELDFFNNRLGGDFSMYRNLNKNQIMQMAIPNVSGYNSMMINAGLIVTTGFDLTLNGTPIKTKDITWNVNFNIGQSTPIIERLAQGQSDYRVTWEFSNMFVDDLVGKEWGWISGRKMIHYQAYDAKGNPIYSPSNGKIVVSNQGQVLYNEDQSFGCALPKFTGGLSSSFKFNNFDLSMALNFQIGGLYFAKSEMLRDYKGLSPTTVALNDKGVDIREPISAGGGIKPANAVTADGNPFNTYVPAMAFFGTYWYLTEPYIYHATYVKMDQIRLGYSLPKKWLQRTPLKAVNVGVVMTDPFLIYNAARGSGNDPSEADTNYGDNGQLPATRTMGFNIKITL
jgi:TonB-linked SusC/RagA family outer membrane protein